MPKVSICIPTYQQLNFLELTLNSIKAQDFVDYEIIITDDTPDSSVLDLIKTFNFKGRLTYHKNKETLGSPKNWNKAISLAKGDYIKILHHDDYFSHRTSLSKFVKMLDDHPESDFGFSSANARNVEFGHNWIHKPSTKVINQLVSNPLILFFGNIIGPPSSTIYKRESSFNYDENLKWLVDIDFYIRFLKANKLFQYNQEPLITSISGAKHNVTNNCINNKEVEVKEYLYLYRKNYYWKLIFNLRFLLFFRSIFKIYNIQSKSDLKALNINFRPPLPIIFLLTLRKLINVFQK
ncbi:glycosyltransferase [Pedobacter sp. Leaf250]|uniref:glycosyltransferase family 2 protein n=1 Tax=Pedobacter sp. Leaf250 TaxID=2876559 RepID=UPI001E54B666|nr:glycosyltransferase [Pedobacter sp. Leaf250]